MVNAIKLALQESGGKVGPFRITYVSLDSATPEAQTWTGAQVLDNARQAVRDLNAIAYIGDRDSAATALSLPLTNEGHVLQVSPSSTYDGLTRPSRRQGEPDRFYPSGQRTFGRVVPADHVQASALLGYMKTAGARSLALLADREIYGGGIADEIEKAAAREGITVYDRGRIDALKEDLSGPARKVAETGADAFLFAGTTDTGAARIFEAVAAAAPRMLLFGPAAVADTAFAEDLPAAVQRRMHVTTPALPRAPAAARRAHVPRQVPSDVRPPAGARGPAGLRGRQGGPARDRCGRDEGQRPRGGDEGVLRDPQPRVRARPVLDRRSGRHEPVPLRRKSYQGLAVRPRQAARGPPLTPPRDRCGRAAARHDPRMHASDQTAQSRCPPVYDRPASVFSPTEEGSILRFKSAAALGLLVPAWP